MSDNAAHRDAADDRLLHHAYDGIQEFDNPTPAWWHVIFLATAVFAAFYVFFFHFSPLAPTIQDQWQARQTADYARIFGTIGELTPDVDTVQRMRANPQMMAVAKATFQAQCSACHARDGGGINGVNLTDDHYKNIKSVSDFFTVITKGANNGAMPAWENRLLQNERVILAAYAMNLRGTTPANPKAPEGEPLPPFLPPPPAAPPE